MLDYWTDYRLSSFAVSLLSICLLVYMDQMKIQGESKNPPPTVFWNFFPDVWEFLINCLHTYYAIFSTLDYKFLFQYLQLWRSYAILTTKRDHLANFYILSLLTEQMTSLLTSCHIQLVCWHYKSSRSEMTCHRQRSTKLDYQRFSQTCERVRFGRWWTLWAYYVN